MSATTPLNSDVPDLEKSHVEYPAKKLDLWWSVPNAITEWKNGNRTRVLKYYLLQLLAGLLIGAVIFLVIHFVVRK
jgi:hypothetical protein